MKLIIDKRENELFEKLSIYLEMFENKNIKLENDVVVEYS